MPYGYKIQYTDPATGTVSDITGKVTRFTVTASRENYCREMVLEIADPAFYRALPLTRIPAVPAVEILTRTADDWKSQGRFYIERPATSHELDSSLARGVWGRSGTAALGEPFASKRSISVEADTTFFTLAADLITGAGLTWDPSQSDITDFPVYAYTYARENAYPIEILSELAGYAGAFVTTSRTGAVRIVQIDYAPAAADLAIDDAQVEHLSESPEWPAFGNRIRITPAAGLAGFRMEVTVPDPCMPSDGQSIRCIYARLTDADGEPVQNAPVDWSSDAQAAGLSSVRNNTGTRLMPVEEVRAINYHEIEVTFPPSKVRGVWAYADKARRNNLAGPGYQIDGRIVRLFRPLRFCDQLVQVAYFCAGVAVNRVMGGETAEDVTVTASVEGTSHSGTVYIGNACQCPPSIELEITPARIKVYQSAVLLVYAEEAGPIRTGRTVYLAHTNESVMGSLTWGRARLGKVKITHEQTAAQNDIAGVTQTTVARYISDVEGVWQVDASGAARGENLFSGSFVDKTIDLKTLLNAGTALVVTYVATGAALARFDSFGVNGVAHFTAWIQSNREAPAEAREILYIDNPQDPYGDQPDTKDGGSGGTAYDDWPDDGYIFPDDSEDDDDGGSGGSGGDDSGDDGSGDDGSGDDDGYLIPDPGYWDGDDDGSGGDGSGDVPPLKSGYCRDANGKTIYCNTGEECCYGPDGNIGCFPSSQCKSGTKPACLPVNIASNPSIDLSERFDSELDRGCTCEELCRNEMDFFQTTQNFDDGSYRTIGRIAEEDYGLAPDSPEYNEKTAELEQQALEQCMAQCDECGDVAPLAANDGGTLDPPGSKAVSFTGGTGPFTWTVTGGNGSLEAGQTNARENVVNVNDPDACGSVVITVKDETCGTTCEIGVRMTNGGWVSSDRTDCPVTGSCDCQVSPPSGIGTSSGTGVIVSGRWRITERYKYVYRAGSSDPDNFEWPVEACDSEMGTRCASHCPEAYGCDLPNACVTEIARELCVCGQDGSSMVCRGYCLSSRTVQEWRCSV